MTKLLVRATKAIAIQFLFLIGLFIPFSAVSQSPYQINWKKEAVYLGIGVVGISGGLYLQSNIDPLNIEAIATLDKMNVNAFDRNAIFNNSHRAGKASDYLVFGSSTLPFLFLTNRKTRKDFGTIFLLYSETLLLTEGVTGFTKRAVLRTRPFVYNETFDLSDKLTLKARFSFFSGHTSVTAANFFFTAKVYNDFFPDSKLKNYVWGAAIVAPALTGYFRVKAGKHYPTDVITGYFFGALVGFMVPHLHLKQKDKNFQIVPGANGVSINWKFN